MPFKRKKSSKAAIAVNRCVVERPMRFWNLKLPESFPDEVTAESDDCIIGVRDLGRE